jgi:hypothetical protein
MLLLEWVEKDPLPVEEKEKAPSLVSKWGFGGYEFTI